MELFYKFGVIILAILVGYFIGSIPTSVIIGKVFFNKDVRQYGSHNAGGTNAGRVFGRKVGATVMLLDIFKSALPVWGVFLLVRHTELGLIAWTPWTYYLAAAGEMVGHCYPIFAKFKGGKAVSSFAGFVFATNWILGLVGVVTMLVILKIKKHVSLGSIVGSAFVSVFALFSLLPETTSFGFWPGMEGGIIYIVILTVETLYLFERHHENIGRLLSHKESRIKWMG
jgi:acyl phosphate:glycerol-3-phosphate acyltransferase